MLKIVAALRPAPACFEPKSTENQRPPVQPMCVAGLHTIHTQWDRDTADVTAMSAHSLPQAAIGNNLHVLFKAVPPSGAKCWAKFKVSDSRFQCKHNFVA